LDNIRSDNVRRNYSITEGTYSILREATSGGITLGGGASGGTTLEKVTSGGMKLRRDRIIQD
jgi:hypothetical protein